MDDETIALASIHGDVLMTENTDAGKVLLARRDSMSPCTMMSAVLLRERCPMAILIQGLGEGVEAGEPICFRTILNHQQGASETAVLRLRERIVVTAIEAHLPGVFVTVPRGEAEIGTITLA